MRHVVKIAKIYKQVSGRQHKLSLRFKWLDGLNNFKTILTGHDNEKCPDLNMTVKILNCLRRDILTSANQTAVSFTGWDSQV